MYKPITPCSVNKSCRTGRCGHGSPRASLSAIARESRGCPTACETTRKASASTPRRCVCGRSAVGLHVLLHCGDAPAAPSWGLIEGSEPSVSMTMAFRAVKVVSLVVLHHGDEDLSTARPIQLLHTLHSQYLSCLSMSLVRSLSAGPENRRIRYMRARQSGVPLQVL